MLPFINKGNKMAKNKDGLVGGELVSEKDYNEAIAKKRAKSKKEAKAKAEKAAAEAVAEKAEAEPKKAADAKAKG